MSKIEIYRYGEQVGWVAFDPYEYEYTGDFKPLEERLEDGPIETVRTGVPPSDTDIELRDDSREIMMDEEREATIDEQIDEMVVEIEACGMQGKLVD